MEAQISPLSREKFSLILQSMKHCLLGLLVIVFHFVKIPVSSQIIVKSDANFQVLTDSVKNSRIQVLGYRVILAFDSNKPFLDSIKLQFQEKYPKTDAYIFFESPNFKLVVGDFRTEIEALWFANKLPIEYPLSLVQKMPINLPRID